MKLITYYIFLLVFIALLTGFVLTGSAAGHAMSMPTILSVCGLLVLYTALMSLVGEGRSEDERATSHRYFASRMALLAGTTVLSIGIIVQLLNNQLDYWSLTALVVINITKIISLVYADHKQ
jgi:putative effector of murein hydrolase LrgA (UPF0299 family)